MAVIDIQGNTVGLQSPGNPTNPNADLAIKAPVRVATTGSNITLSGAQTIDGVALSVGDRVLVKDQTDQTTNGFYNVQTGPWTRSIDANSNSDWSDGVQVAVTSGTVNGGNTWKLTTVNPIILGTSLLTFALQAVSVTPVTVGVAWFNVKTYGAKGDDVTDDTTAIDTAITALNGAGGGTLYFPADTYLVSSALVISSNTRVTGDGWNSVIKGTPGLAAYAPFATATGATGYFLLTNSSYSGGNSEIMIDNIAFDLSNVSSGASHNVHLRNVSHFAVTNCLFNRGGDGFATTASNDYHVQGCHAIGQSNAGLDQWDGCTDGTWIGNTVDCLSTTNSYGILCTGVTTIDSPNTTKRIKIIGNTVRNVNLTGIWVQGGQNGVAAGSVLDSIVSGNTVDTGDFGIRVSEAQRIIVSGNAISNSQLEGINSAAELNQAAVNCLFVGNTVYNASSIGAGTAPAIHLQNTSAGNLVANNNVEGSNHTYAVLADAGSSGNTIVDITGAAGTSGFILNSGNLTNLVAPNPGLLRFAVTGINFNSAHTDNAFSIGVGTARWAIDRISISNASASISTATVGVFSSTGGGGSAIAADQAITVTASGADNANSRMDLTLTAPTTVAFDYSTLYVRVGTPQGSGATADVIIYVRPLT